MTEFRLDGRKALVTGANTGIGQAIATTLAGAGAHVVCAGRSAMDETIAGIDAAGGTASACAMDLSEVHRVGAADDDRVVPGGLGEEEDRLEVHVSQAFARAVLARGGRGKIINIASMLSFQGGIRVASYIASKSGILGLTRLLACEWAARGINVNAIAPGYIATANTRALREDAARN